MRLSQQKLGDLADVSRNVICGIEKGRNFVKAQTLECLAEIFNIKPYELLKPDNVMPDNAPDIIAKYSEHVKEAIDKVGDFYMGDKK